PGRVMGTIVEIHSDEKGIIWPASVAPYAIHLVGIFNESGSVKKAADDLYKQLRLKGIETLYDDREASAGEKFSDADLIGIPKRAVISEKTLANGSVEVKDRATGKVEMKAMHDLLC